jgi:hypothetical protein
MQRFSRSIVGKGFGSPARQISTINLPNGGMLVNSLRMTPFIDHPETMQQLKRAMEMANGTIYVYWSPSGTGKTSYLKWVGQEVNNYFSDSISVQILDSSDFRFGESLPHSISEGKKSVIAINRFDHAHYRMIEPVIEEALHNKTTFILTISDPVAAEAILSMSRQVSTSLILGQRWNREQMTRFIEGQSLWQGVEKERLIELGLLSGNPRFIRGLLSMESINLFSGELDELAKMHHASWEGGYRVLYRLRYP